jgi:hypothetical protein
MHNRMYLSLSACQCSYLKHHHEQLLAATLVQVLDDLQVPLLACDVEAGRAILNMIMHEYCASAFAPHLGISITQQQVYFLKI